MDPLSNSTNVRADTVELWDEGSASYKGIREFISGIPPETLNTLERLAEAIGNDSTFYETIAGDLALKQTSPSLQGNPTLLILTQL